MDNPPVITLVLDSAEWALPFRRAVYNLASIVASSGLDPDVTVTTHDGHPRTGTLELDHDDIVIDGFTWIPVADVARIDVHSR